MRQGWGRNRQLKIDALHQVLEHVGSCVFTAWHLADVMSQVVRPLRCLNQQQIARMFTWPEFDYVKLWRKIGNENLFFLDVDHSILCNTDLSIIQTGHNGGGKASILCISKHHHTCVLSHFDESLGDLDLEGEEGPRNARK